VTHGKSSRYEDYLSGDKIIPILGGSIMVKSQILLPDPSRLIEGLRDTGYDFDTALADIVDNSVDAGASLINVWIRMDTEGEITVSVADNGCGMDYEGLLNAMTYGADSKKNKCSLGKFGLGLKTASTAFCRRFSVISRPGKSAEELKFTWDLDHVVKQKQWEVLLDEPKKDEIDLLDEASGDGPGTVVVWENVDRLLKAYEDPKGRFARKALEKIVTDFREHASMVYQRFLDPKDERARNAVMNINGENLPSWDPFCRGVSGAEMVASKDVEVDLGDGQISSFTVNAFVLPRREEFASPEAAKAARLENKNQGFYIYRENRLIHAADWLDMYTKEPHGSLLRVEFSFDHTLDDAFLVDIKKSRILLKDELYNWIKDKFIPGPRRAAEERYRKGEKKKAQEKAEDAHTSSNASIAAKEEDLKLAEITVKNPNTGEVEITNKQGRFRIRMSMSSSFKPGQTQIQPVPSIDDGLLWDPCIIEGHHGVRINTGHPYYHKVYLPNIASGVTIQGMDSLLWALAEAELGATTDITRKHFNELRFEISRLLRTLVEDLPDPELEDEANNNA
jgi:hypothetical protein